MKNNSYLLNCVFFLLIYSENPLRPLHSQLTALRNEYRQFRFIIRPGRHIFDFSHNQ